MRMQKASFLVALAIGIFLASCSKKEEVRPPSVVNVKTMRVSPSTHVVGKSYMGTIEEEDGANVSFDVTGNVKKVYVEEGQFVKKGQVMAEVDGENIRSAYEHPECHQQPHGDPIARHLGREIRIGAKDSQGQHAACRGAGRKGWI